MATGQKTKCLKKFKDVLFLYFRISESLLGVECLWVIVNIILCRLLSVVIYIGQTMDDKKGTLVLGRWRVYSSRHPVEKERFDANTQEKLLDFIFI